MIFRSGTRTSTRTVIIVAAAYVLAVGLYVGLFLLPTLGELASLRDNAQTQRTTLSAMGDLQQRHIEVMSEYNAALAWANDLYSRFPREADIPRILNVITNLTKANGASQEHLSYSPPEWKDNMGQLRISALFSGNFTQLARLAVQLPQALPSAQLQEVRFVSVLKGAVSTNAGVINANAREAGGLFPGLSNSTFAGAISNAFGLSTYTPPKSSVTVDTTISPLEIDHTEMQVNINIWLVAEEFVATAANLPLRGWYARQAGAVSLPSFDPFVPSAKARELVAWREVLDKLEDTQVTGILSGSGGKTMASLQVLGTTYTVAVGDKIPPLNNAKVVSIQSDRKQVTLDIGGQQISLTMGGTK